MAIQEGQKDIASRLLRSYPQKYNKDINRMKSIILQGDHWAGIYGHEEMLRYLLEKNQIKTLLSTGFLDNLKLTIKTINENIQSREGRGNPGQVACKQLLEQCLPRNTQSPIVNAYHQQSNSDNRMEQSLGAVGNTQVTLEDKAKAVSKPKK